ncbi:MAG: hypothetical protein K1X57_15925 [Gemmataceae bacterium]|nr:hypothetical protein [Gemmataceae bacterium]
MTRGNTTSDTLSHWKPTGVGPHTLSIPVDAGTVTVTAERCEGLAARLISVAATTGRIDACTPAELSERAGRIAGRVSAVLEPLKVYEVDGSAGAALLRSQTPEVRYGQTRYFEVKLIGHQSAELRKYCVEEGKPGRSADPYTLTHEVVEKIAGHFLATDAGLLG